jgi:outer membrane protein OmpA-like peptidoglycan-associated protein
MVMPEEGGKAGTVAVTLNDGNEIVLHGEYSAMSLAGDDKKTYVSNREEMLNTFGTVVAALPQAPVSATLYFVLGKDVLTPESKLEAERIFNEIVNRQVPEILIIGHTDTVGSTKTNDKLSLKRAEKIRQSLIKLGVPADSIKVIGRGERELLVKTPDNTKEPKNRRAEINVR